MSIRPANAAGPESTELPALSLDFLTTGSSDLNRILKLGAERIRARNNQMKLEGMKTASSAPVIFIVGNDENEGKDPPFSIREQPQTNDIKSIADAFVVTLVNKHGKTVASLRATLDDIRDSSTCGCATNFTWKFLDNYNPNANKFELMTPAQVTASEQIKMLVDFNREPSWVTTHHACAIKAHLISSATYAERYAFYMLTRHLEFWIHEAFKNINSFNELPVKPKKLKEENEQKQFFNKWKDMMANAYNETAKMRTEVAYHHGGLDELVSIGYQNDGSDGRIPYPPKENKTVRGVSGVVLRLNRENFNM